MYDTVLHMHCSEPEKKLSTREASDTPEGISAVWVVFWIAAVTLF